MIKLVRFIDIRVFSGSLRNFREVHGITGKNSSLHLKAHVVTCSNVVRRFPDIYINIYYYYYIIVTLCYYNYYVTTNSVFKRNSTLFVVTSSPPLPYYSYYIF